MNFEIPRRLAAGRSTRALVAFVEACALTSVALDLQQGAVVTLRGFKTQGRAENGARWRLQGDSAVIRGTVYELTGVIVDLELEDGRTARITSRACVYHQDSGLVESHDPVRMESGGTTLDGVGFDMLMSDRRLRVRDAVRVEIPSAGVRLDALGPAKAETPRAVPDTPAVKP
jgi:hypothetical protein